MNTRFIETFVLLAQLRNVRQVAHQMHTTPGTISMRIRKLEETLGGPLFNWDFKTLEITSRGTRVLRYAEQVIEATQAFERAAQPHAYNSGRIRLGVNETVALTLLPHLMRVFKRIMPELQIDLSVELTPDLHERLMQRDLDLIIHVSGWNTFNPFVHSHPLFEVTHQWIAKPHPFSADIPLQQVLRHQLITQMRGTQPYEEAKKLIERLISSQQLSTSDIRLSGSPSVAAMISLVKGGLGIGIMPPILVLRELADRELVVLTDPPIPTTPTGMSISHMKNASPLITDTREIINHICRNYCRRFDERNIRFTGALPAQTDSHKKAGTRPAIHVTA